MISISLSRALCWLSLETILSLVKAKHECSDYLWISDVLLSCFQAMNSWRGKSLLNRCRDINILSSFVLLSTITERVDARTTWRVDDAFFSHRKRTYLWALTLLRRFDFYVNSSNARCTSRRFSHALSIVFLFLYLNHWIRHSRSVTKVVTLALVCCSQHSAPVVLGAENVRWTCF